VQAFGRRNYPPLGSLRRDQELGEVLGGMTVITQDRRVADRRRSSDRRVASDVAPEELRVRRAGVTLIAALSVADVITSSWMRARHGTELNPIAGWLLDHGLLELAKLVAVGSVAGLLHRARAAAWIMPAVWFVAGIYTAVITLHLWQLAAPG
jgi:hypothetical protein